MARFISLVLSVLLFIALFFCAVKKDGEEFTEEPRAETVIDFEVSLPELGVVSLVNDAVAEWMKGQFTAAQLYNVYHSKIGNLDYPAPVKITFGVTGVPNGEDLISQVVELSENEDFSGSEVFEVPSHKDEVLLYNLKTDTKYYYRVTVFAENGEIAVASSEFVTADTPRILYVDGIRNVRDIGGYKTADGRKIKQGMLYRGSELRGTENAKLMISEDGENTLISDFGVRSEFDLRGKGEGSDPLSESINREYYSFYYNYSQVFSDNGMKCIKEIFSDLANPENYPVYMHCMGGSDRTGTVVYLLMAMLGVSDKDCYGEWELSAFYSSGKHYEDMDEFIGAFDEVPGDTLSERVENFLLLAGVTTDEIESIKEILLSE